MEVNNNSKLYIHVLKKIMIINTKYRIAGKFGGGKVWRIGHLEVLAKESLANIEDSH